jgi:DNA-binding transcriptional ArsR family regulator
MSVKVVDLVGGPRGLAVEVVASLPSEMLAGILKYGMPESVDTFDVGREWFDTVRARMSAELLALLVDAPELGGSIGYVLEEPRPQDVPGFIARLESLPKEELWLALAGYHFPPFRRRLGDEVFHRALDRDQEAGRKLIAELEQMPSAKAKKAGIVGLQPKQAKALTLEVLERWYREVFRQEEQETLEAIERDAEAKRRMAVSMSPESLIESATNGLQFQREDWVQDVVLLPHVSMRPWNVMSAWDGTYVLSYPVADESLGIDAGAPPGTLVRLHKALGDEKRLRMLKVLAGGTATLQELARATGLAKSSAHHHLVILRSAGLVLVTIGEESVYTLRREFIPRAAAMLETFLEGRPR